MFLSPSHQDTLDSFPVEHNQTRKSVYLLHPQEWDVTLTKTTCFLGFLVSYSVMNLPVFFIYFDEKSQAFQNKTTLNIYSWKK